MLGSTIGHYHILEKLGEGGMGEVYLAEDTSLDRRVALKVLAPALAGNPDRRERFIREAKAVAALSHPNIVTVYSVEHAGDVHFLTMELVEGRTAAELIPAGGLPLDRVLALAVPLADAVAAAHDRGITHRDLKPANVMVTADGRVKVLDFGLAKLTAPGGAIASAETALGGASALTGEGRIVGTVAYMSPEQAEGRAVDHRTDLFSLGVLLYEMTTGVRPFTGETSLSVLSAIMKDTPKPVSDVNPRVPRELGKIIRRCLQKDPEQRFQSAKDVRNELQELQRDLASGELDAPPATVAVPARTTRSRLLLWAAAGVVMIAVAALVVPGMLRAPATTPVSATFTQITFQSGIERQPSLSPDGKWVVFVAFPNGNADIFLQSVGGQATINLTEDSTAGDLQPAFSPNGEEIAFRSGRQGGGIFVMRRTGEFVRRITDAGFNPSWSPDGKSLVYGTEPAQSNPYGRSGVSELWAVDVATGGKRRIYEGDAMEPRFSPDGQLIAFWAVPRGTSRRDIFTMPSAGGAPVALTDDEDLDAVPIWAPDGRSMYFVSDRGGSLNLWKIGVDAGGRPIGAPMPITSPATFIVDLSLSADGRQIVYTAVTGGSNIRRYAFDPAAGVVTGEGTSLTSSSRFITDIDVSADGSRLVYRAGVTQEDLFVSNADGTRERQLTSDRARDRYPAWSPKGDRIAFYSDRGGGYDVWSIAPDGGGARQMTGLSGVGLAYPFWSPDGSRIGGTNLRDFIVTLFDPNVAWSAQQAEQLPLRDGLDRFIGWSWSPDGTKIAGRTRRTLAVYDIATKSYKDLPGTPAASPIWLPDNRRLLYSAGSRVMVVDIVTGAIKEAYSTAPDLIRSLSISSDGRQLFVAQGANEADIWMARLQ